MKAPNDQRCLYCYRPLTEGETDYHPRCSLKLFGSRQPPQLPYRSDELKELAHEVIRSQTTLTGVQPKLSLDLQTERGTTPRLTIVGLWGRFILKPQTEYLEHLPELEDLTMHLAELAKIETVPHGLIRFLDGELCYITRRIDRDQEGRKIPMEDMCQLSERMTEDKYKGSHEQVAKLVIRHCATSGLDLVRYWELVLFSWLVGNADMHLKNFSLFAPDGQQYRLSPAYDLLSTTLVLPEDTEELALPLCGKKRKLGRRQFAGAMEASGLNSKVVMRMFDRFARLLPIWESRIRESFLPLEMQERYLELVRERIHKLSEDE